ncbi:MAG: hypothetical protein J0L97_02250 [Alphaproteobacteria bacterium]|nr:hypothetical protein [Alphaproteobacteria bacterium]
MRRLEDFIGEKTGIPVPSDYNPPPDDPDIATLRAQFQADASPYNGVLERFAAFPIVTAERLEVCVNEFLDGIAWTRHRFGGTCPVFIGDPRKSEEESKGPHFHYNEAGSTYIKVPIEAIISWCETLHLIESAIKIEEQDLITAVELDLFEASSPHKTSQEIYNDLPWHKKILATLSSHYNDAHVMQPLFNWMHPPNKDELIRQKHQEIATKHHDFAFSLTADCNHACNMFLSGVEESFHSADSQTFPNRFLQDFQTYKTDGTTAYWLNPIEERAKIIDRQAVSERYGRINDAGPAYRVLFAEMHGRTPDHADVAAAATMQSEWKNRVISNLNTDIGPSIA